MSDLLTDYANSRLKTPDFGLDKCLEYFCNEGLWEDCGGGGCTRLNNTIYH